MYITRGTLISILMMRAPAIIKTDPTIAFKTPPSLPR
jgi:hypothetical protein